jgi:hypothetical protein
MGRRAGGWWIAIGLLLPLLPTGAANGAPPAPPDPYTIALGEARAAMAKQDWAEAIQKLDEARKESGEPVDGGPRIAQAAIEQGNVELKRKQPRAALTYYRQASALALDVFWLRRRAFDKRIAATQEGKFEEEEKRVRELIKHDAEVMARLAAPFVPEKLVKHAELELETAAHAFDRDHDPVHAGWARAVKAKMLAWSNQSADAMAIVKPVLEQKPPAIPMIRQRALEAAYKAAIVDKDLEGETGYALELNALKNAKLTPEQRRYARTPLIEATCARYEKVHNPGSCAMLAAKITGEYSFHDHSRGRIKKSLSSTDIETAQAQYLPLLEECIHNAAAGRNDELFDDATITIGWAVENKGRVIELEISPHRYEPVIGACVTERIGWFRYPRFTDGEHKSVSIPYELKSKEIRLGISRQP